MKFFALTLSLVVFLVLVVPPVKAGPLDGIQWVGSLEEAMKQAKERGSLIYIAMTIDGEESNENQKAQFLDAALIKASADFVCIYANPHAQGSIEVEVDGKMERRVKDAPTITMKQAHKCWNDVANNYSQNRASDDSVKIPYNFMIDGEGKFISSAVAGTVEGGFDVVPAAALVQWMNIMNNQHGKGLSTKDYLRLKKVLADGKLALKAKKIKKALKLLGEVVKTNERSALATQAKKLIEEISEGAKSALEEGLAKVDEDPIEGMMALGQVVEDYPGTDVAKKAKAKIAELSKRKDVKKRLKDIELQKEAMGQIEKAEEIIAAEEYLKAIALLEKVARKYKKLPAAKTATDRVAALKGDEEIAKKIHAQQAERFSKKVLSMGRNYVKNGMKPQAKKEFQKIIDKYPDSPWADEAKKELEKLK